MKKMVFSLLTGILVMGLATGCGNKTSASGGDIGENKNSGEKEVMELSMVPEQEVEAVFNDVESMEETEEEVFGNPVPVVDNGIKFWVPADYWCYLEEEKGIIVYQRDVFTLLLGIREGTLDEKMENPELLQKGAIEAGGKIEGDVELVEIGGHEYAYFPFTMGGSRFVVAYTDASDSGNRVGAQIQVRDESASDLDMVAYFARVASTAEITDEPDSTEESLDEAKHISYIGVEKEESSLAYGNNQMTFQVEEGFYSSYTESDDYWAVEYFEEDGHSRSIDVVYMPNDDWGSAENLIAYEAEWSSGVVAHDSVEVNGYTFYYIERDYEDEGDSIQRVLAACDMGNGMIYRISVWAMNVEQDVNIEDIATFMEVDD